MIRKTLGLLAGAALLAALTLGAGPASAAGQEDRDRHPGHSADLFGDHRLSSRRSKASSRSTAPTSRSARSTTAPRRRARWSPATSIWPWSPTPPVINQISNAGVPLVAVYGMPNPDWVLGTTESGKTCKDLVGQDVGVDSIGGARSVALRSMLDRLPRREARRQSSRSRSAPAPGRP